MPGQRVSKSSIGNEEDAGLRRSSRHKAPTNDEQSPIKENEDQSPIEPSPLSTRSSRNKYVRKPLHQYGEQSSSSSPYEKNQSREDYTKILPPNETGNVNYEIPGENQHREYPYSTNDEGKKLSVIQHTKHTNIDNVMSPPIGACKTSSPVNSTEIFEAPTSAIVGPLTRTTRYNSKSSANSHDESYISSRSERQTRVQGNSSVRHISMSEDATCIEELSEHISYSKTKQSSLKSNLDLSCTPERHQNIIRHQEKRENQDQEWKATIVNSLGIFASAVIIVIIALLMNSKQSNSGLTSSRRLSTKVVINALKEMLPSQTEDTWKVIASNIHRIKERRSNQAACIVFVQNASDNNHNGGEKCIVSTIAKEISMLQKEQKIATALVNGTVNSKDFRNDKAGLYSAVEHSLSKNSVVTILDINYLSGGSAMALHSFCDSDPTGGEDPTMAPYVHKAVLSTLQVINNDETNQMPSDQSNTQGYFRKAAHMLAEQELSRAWEKEIGEDKAASLISRVALNAVFLKPEKSDIAGRLCP